MDESTSRIRHCDSMRQAILSALFPTFVLFILAPAVGDAQVSVVTNITSSAGAGDLGTLVSLPHNNIYDITGGTRPGDGPVLTHSFGDFILGAGHTANFLNTTPDLPTSNILGRVTGGNPSSIFGTIDTLSYPGANLFLVNPAGILFGPTASVNVGGSVSFSTAQYIRLSDGVNSANFYANPANDSPSSDSSTTNSIFAVDPVVNFGFLSPAAYGFLDAPNPLATITVQGSALSVLPGQSISLVGGTVVIQGDTQPAHLSAPNGNIFLATAASPGEFDLATLQSLPNNPVDPASAVSFTSFGSISLASTSSIDVNGASTVFIKGGQLVLSVNNATLSTAESSAPHDIDTISLGSGSSIVTSNSGADPGADVQIAGGTLNLDGAGTAITTQTLGDGIGGNITANVGTLSLANGASLNSNNFSFTFGEDGNFIFGNGQGGNLTIQGLTGADSAADSVMLTSGSAITTQTLSSKPGGDVTIAAGGVHLDASTITTNTFGPGRGGEVQITANSLTIENSSTLTTETSFLGEVGGGLLLNVGTFRLMGGEFGGSLIRSINGPGVDLDGDGAMEVKGNGGNITIQGTVQSENNAAESVILSGSSGITSGVDTGSGGGGRISIRATSLDLNETSFIKSSTAAFGTDLDGDGVLDDLTSGGGDIMVSTQNLRVVDGATITSSTSFIGDAPAVAGGTVTVEGLKGPGSQAGSVWLFGQNTRIDSNSFSGVPGDITVTAGTLTITNGAVINTGSGQAGPAGNVGITADSVVISADGQIFSRSAARGAGQVTITADELTLDKGSIVTRTFSEQEGRGGNVVLNGGTVSLTNGASINSQSERSSTGDAGNITMNNLKSLTLSNHAEITSSSTGIRENAGDAGTITITTIGDAVSLASGSSITSSTIGGGDAGQVIITAPTLSLNDATITTSTSGTGNAGGIKITTTDSTLSLANGSQISSASTGTDAISNFDGTTEPPGTAGNITITAAGSFTSNASSIATSAEANHGGDISITAQNVQLSGGTLITANSNAPLEVTKLILDSGDPDGLKTVSVPAVGDDGRSDGNAGNMSITSNSNVTIQNSSVTTEASQASGGQVTINAAETGMVQLINSKVTTSVHGGGETAGGDINIDPQFVILQNSQILAQAFAGAGGNIGIVAQVFIADPNSLVDASSQLGISGTVDIRAPVQNVSGELVVLTHDFASAASLLAQQCAARVADGTFSTFVVAAREGLPVEPGGFLPSPSFLTELGGLAFSGQLPRPSLLATEGLFTQHDAKPIQLAKLGSGCGR